MGNLLDLFKMKPLIDQESKSSMPENITKLNCRTVLVLLTTFLLFFMLIAQNNVETSIYLVQNRPQSTPRFNLIKETKPLKRVGYLGIDNQAVGGSGMCNKLFELVSCIGIAYQLNRTPYISTSSTALKVFGGIIRPLFPGLEEQYKIANETVVKHFHQGRCCFYRDISFLRNYKDEYLHLDGIFYQSFKYFDVLREDIRKWLLPNETIQKQAENNLPAEYRNHFIVCAHTRRGDFLTDRYHEASNPEFLTKALDYLMKKYETQGRKVAGVVVGDDPKWARTVFGGKNKVLVVENTLEQEFAFTRRYCDVLLITTPSSTFGWFMGYLSKNFTVYYRDPLNTMDTTRHEIVQKDFFLPSWTKIWEEKGVIKEASK